jgi:XTP/dITP diphosphohydrolase
MSTRPRLVIATRNSGKVAELADLLSGLDVELISLRDFPGAPEVQEDAPSYRENATRKARAIARYAGLPALADDSGLEVDALDGHPGVRSARFAGDPCDDRRNIQKLLRLLRRVPLAGRGARFRCVVVVAKPDLEATLEGEGTCEGVITQEARGEGGFGYDPVFMVPQFGKTFAEMDAAEKHRRSHRGRACAALRSRLVEFLESGSRDGRSNAETIGTRR